MNKLTIKLKQHTPLIHFQHDQEGATLRASEVKPKLDQFILTKLGKEKYEETSDEEYVHIAEEYDRNLEHKIPFDDLYDINIGIQYYEIGKFYAKKEKWLVGKGDHPALDYKMRIEIDESAEIKEYLLASYINNDGINTLRRKGIQGVNNTPYFAQEKENGYIINDKLTWDEIGKKGIQVIGDIRITIISKIQEVSDYIAKNIQSFFISTNFGTRQSKGFGSFTTKEITNRNISVELKDNEVLLKSNFLFVYKKNLSKNKTVQNIFTNINNDYRLLKSGLTRPYAKSKLMLFAKSVGWDKKFIKSKVTEIFDNDDRVNYRLKCEESHRKDNYEVRSEYRFYRALLGLAEQFEFLLENERKNKLIVKISNPDIMRYKSPLLFKVVDDNIYLVGNDVASEMLNQHFELLLSMKEDHHFKGNIKGGIFTPKMFSLKKFIQFAMNDDTNGAKLKYEQIK